MDYRVETWRMSRPVQRVGTLSHLTPHTSHLTPHTSHLTPNIPHLTPHTSHLSPHTSHLPPVPRPYQTLYQTMLLPLLYRTE